MVWMECTRLLRKSMAFRTKFILLFLPVLVGLVYVSVGKYRVPIMNVLRLDFYGVYEKNVILHVRLPRAVMAATFGGVAGLCGAAIQSLLKNPLASPYILGIASGAAFGASLSMALSLAVSVRQAMAALFGLSAVGLSLLAARVGRQIYTHSIVLGGVIVSALFTGLLSLVQILVAPEQTQAMVSWIIGRLNNIKWDDVVKSLPVTILCCGALLVLRWRLFILSLGEDEAKTVGARVQTERLAIIALVTIATSSVVSVCGVIGWVCLITPHLARLLVGPHPPVLLPTAVSIGASFMLMADMLSRVAWIHEIPVGVVTTLVGAPLFLFLMHRGGHGWRD